MLRGSEVNDYQSRILTGILLHRKIDEFTDHHPLVKDAISLFKPGQGRYASVIVDISFDHFLAKKWKKYHSLELNDFATKVYDTMDGNHQILPERFQLMLPKMRSENWLYQYQYLDGIQKAFEGIARRASFETNMANAREGLERNYHELDSIFEEFFDDIIKFVKNEGIEL